MKEFRSFWSTALYNSIPVVLPHNFSLFFAAKIALLNQFLFFWNYQIACLATSSSCQLFLVDVYATGSESFLPYLSAILARTTYIALQG